ncbi:hypothetical protein BGX33_011461 [Mortierella sp. NVP41]|nr:hypothetical protein BGX33_011461 [Mortierella sp. NVP41]
MAYADEEDARRVFESGEQFVLDGRKLGLQYAQGRRKTLDEEENVAAPAQPTATTDQAPAATRAHDLPPEIAVIADVTAAAPDAVVRTADRAHDPLGPDLALPLIRLAAVRHLPVVVAAVGHPRPDAVRLPLAVAPLHPDVVHPPLVIALLHGSEAQEIADHP